MRTGSTSSQTQGYSESKSYSWQGMPLLRPEEVMRLPVHKTLIMRTGHAPVKAGQWVWYKEKEMKYFCHKEIDVPCLDFG